MEDHLLECPYAKVECTYHSIGCSVKVNEIDILCAKYNYLVVSACVIFLGFSSAYD